MKRGKDFIVNVDFNIQVHKVNPVDTPTCPDILQKVAKWRLEDKINKELKSIVEDYVSSIIEEES